jgi:pimeloyl-ACP methyl ester carboxylesterase
METGVQEIAVEEYSVRIPLDPFVLEGTLCLPPGATAVVLFAHGSGSSRFSPRNRAVARALQQAKLGTLLLDLLTAEEERVDDETRLHRFDIDLLAGRVVVAIDWLTAAELTRNLPVGLFGASTGAAAALVAASERPTQVRAVVSRGGRPDLAGPALGSVHSPTRLIVGSLDEVVLALNRQALDRLPAAEANLVVVPGASHLFEEPGALEAVSQLAVRWFQEHLPVG